ncbi:MAG: chromate transporter [Oscillospiraceae bacterium]|nr:chromate transporter [Oscillospiraceae bacterium]
MNLYFDLFLTFARIGVCTFGGGYAMLPILQRELVEKKKWAAEGELADYYAVGQCTPGIIAVNTATFVGRSQAGVAGGVFATLGLVFPSIVIIMVIAAFLQNFMDIPWVVHAFNGVRAGVVALIASSVIKLLKTSVIDWPTRVIYAVVLILAAAGTFLPLPGGTLGAVLGVVLSPVFLVIAAGAAGLAVRAAKGGLKG